MQTERTVTANTLLEIGKFRKGRVLPAGTEKVTEGLKGDTAAAALVKEGEGFLVVCRGLLVNIR